MKTNDWRYLTLGDVATIVGGGTPRKRVTDYWNGSVQWATPTDITALHGRKIDRTATTITDSGLAKSSATLLPPNSLLMTTRATIGACAINSIPMATNQGFQNLVPRPDTLVEFLYHLIQHHRRQLELVATGSTFLEVSRRALRDFRIVLPPVCEQRKIAAILSSVDDVIEKTRAVIGQLQIVNRSLTSELLNRGLPGDHTRFKRTVIGDVPEVWNVRTVAQSVAKLSAGKRYDKRTREENGNIPIIDQSERRFLAFTTTPRGFTPLSPRPSLLSQTIPVLSDGTNTRSRSSRMCFRYRERPLSGLGISIMFSAGR